jgi:hypothetical protein
MVRTVHRGKPAPELRCYAAFMLPTFEIALNPVVVNSGTAAQAF